VTGARNDVARRKLASLGTYLEELREVRPATLAAYRRDLRARRSVERLLQLLVESAADLVQRLLVLRGLTAPPEYASSFRAAAEAGLIPDDLAEDLVPLAGLRNFLVHPYDRVDDEIVHHEVERALTVFPRLIAVLRRSMRRA
jgi:uncharacterized protein YutE (UPF0331/DUF86 family)